MKTNDKISRRTFMKTMAASGMAIAGLSQAPFSFAKDIQGMTPNLITHRTHPKGAKVSLLGYGCMRWPTTAESTEQNIIIDQEKTNQLVDYALEHGVNYFDVSPIYQQRKSEPATGIALSRHPRSSYYLATKMSNHHIANEGITGQAFIDASKEMYRNSFKNLRTDYIDFYLMHNVGSGSGYPLFKQRFLDSGILDFLLEEREAGRIRNLGFSFHGDLKVFDYLMERHDEIHIDFAQIQMNYVDYRHATGWNTNAEFLYAELTRRGIPVVVMEPLRAGKLASLPDALAARLKAERPDASLASWAFRFVGSFPNVMTALSGMTYMEHLQDNLKTLSPLNYCTPEEFALLEEIAKEYPNP